MSVGVSANKQRPTSSHKSALMAAALSLNNSAQSAKGGNGAQGKKKLGGGNIIAGTLRKSVNATMLAGGTSSLNSSNVLNNSTANYGHLQ